MNERIEKVKSLIQDKAFVEKFANAADVAEIKKLFWESGVDISDEELRAFLTGLQAKVDGNEELSEDQLEQVAGGIVEWIVLGGAMMAVSGFVGYQTHKFLKKNWVSPF